MDRARIENHDLLIVLALLAVAIVLFVRGRPRMDVIAILAILAFPLTGVLSVDEALAGFGNPNVVLIGVLFVIGDGLVRTGIAKRLGDWLVRRAGRSEAKLIALLMTIVAMLGSLMSSTGVVAIFIPVVLRVAARMRIPAGRLLMPLSVAGLISGMLTLVGTAPNLIVHAELVRRGDNGFGFFSFTPFGLPILALGIVYMILVRRRIGRADEDAAHERPDRPNLLELVHRYRLEHRLYRMLVRPGSRLVGQSLADLRLRSNTRISLIAVERPQRSGVAVLSPHLKMRLEIDDILLLDAIDSTMDPDQIERELGLVAMPYTSAYFADHADEVGLAEVLLPPGSELIGQTLASSRFRSRYALTVAGVRRNLKPIEQGLLDEKLQMGDVLLLIGPWKAIKALRAGRQDFVILNLPAELDDWHPAAHRAPLALLSVAVMVVLMVSGVVPNVTAALIACLAMGAFGCVTVESSYRAIHWQSLILIAGMLPFALALERTGGITLAVDGLIASAGTAGPYVMLACLFAATAIIGLFISNTATAVLMAPVAIGVAHQMGLSPQPFAMTVALAASTAFMTPVSSPVNTLVVEPGHYRFGDFVRIGTPLAILVMLASLLLVAWWMPPGA